MTAEGVLLRASTRTGTLKRRRPRAQARNRPPFSLLLHRHGSAVFLRAGSGGRRLALRGRRSGRRGLRAGWADREPFALQTFDRVAAHVLHAFAEIGGVLEWSVHRAFVEDRSRARRTDALDAA